MSEREIQSCLLGSWWVSLRIAITKTVRLAYRTHDSSETPRKAQNGVSTRSIGVVSDISDGTSELKSALLLSTRRTTPTAPPKIPWISRIQIASGSYHQLQSRHRMEHKLTDSEVPKMMSATALPAIEATITARRPCRSAILLHSRLVKNWVMKNTEIRFPIGSSA